MPHFRASNIIGKTIRQINPVRSGFSGLKEKQEEEKKSEGSGLEQMSDKLDKLIVKPRKKTKNIQFNP